MILLIYTGTFACFSISVKSIFARAVIGSPGVVTHSIDITPVCSFYTLVYIWSNTKHFIGISPGKCSCNASLIFIFNVWFQSFILSFPLVIGHQAASPWLFVRTKLWLEAVRLLVIILTHFTVMASKSGNTQTLVISVCKTGLTGWVVLARFLCTSVLQRKEKT